jgi:hypothetical protein
MAVVICPRLRLAWFDLVADHTLVTSTRSIFET